MLCAVYKSPKKADTYLYLKKREDFSAVPEALLKTFGKPTFVMLVNLEKRDKIANLTKADFLKKFEEQGFYLQLPPKQEDLLGIHRQSLGLQATPEKKF